MTPGRSGFRFRSAPGAAILAGSLALLFAAGAWLRSLATRVPETLPDGGAVAAFAARDAGGRPWTPGDLAGKVWIADALPAGCASCLARSLRMTDLQTSLERAPSVVLLTFVDDPALSSPEKLSELARSFGARAGKWTFVAGRSPFPDPRFALIDASGRIRGLYSESDPALASNILDGVGDLLRERRPARR
jgi:cytochrome oxidase Cu insertion factor (SCO1/SenC/PrrC family)